MMYIHNSALLRGVCTSFITQLRFVMYDVFLHTSASLRVCKKPYQLCTNVITLYYLRYNKYKGFILSTPACKLMNERLKNGSTRIALLSEKVLYGKL